MDNKEKIAIADFNLLLNSLQQHTGLTTKHTKVFRTILGEADGKETFSFYLSNMGKSYSEKELPYMPRETEQEIKEANQKLKNLADTFAADLREFLDFQEQLGFKFIEYTHGTTKRGVKVKCKIWVNPEIYRMIEMARLRHNYSEKNKRQGVFNITVKNFFKKVKLNDLQTSRLAAKAERKVEKKELEDRRRNLRGLKKQALTAVKDQKEFLQTSEMVKQLVTDLLMSYHAELTESVSKSVDFRSEAEFAPKIEDNIINNNGLDVIKEVKTPSANVADISNRKERYLSGDNDENTGECALTEFSSDLVIYDEGHNFPEWEISGLNAPENEEEIPAHSPISSSSSLGECADFFSEEKAKEIGAKAEEGKPEGERKVSAGLDSETQPLATEAPEAALSLSSSGSPSSASLHASCGSHDGDEPRKLLAFDGEKELSDALTLVDRFVKGQVTKFWIGLRSQDGVVTDYFGEAAVETIIKELPAYLNKNYYQPKSLFLRPQNGNFIQIDDCDSIALERYQPFADFYAETSKGNYQVWLKLSSDDSIKDHRRAIFNAINENSRGEQLDGNPGSYGSIRVPGSLKHKKGKENFKVRIVVLDHETSIDELKANNLYKKIEKPIVNHVVAQPVKAVQGKRREPDYLMSLSKFSGDRSKADGNYMYWCLKLGFSTVEAKMMLAGVSEKAKERSYDGREKYCEATLRSVLRAHSELNNF